MKSKEMIHKIDKFVWDVVVRERIKGRASTESSTLKEINKTLIQMFSLFFYKSAFKLNKIYINPCEILGHV